MIELHPLELLPVICYFGLLLVIGFLRRSDAEGEDDFIVGARRLTLPGFIATLVTTWYGGILGVGEFTYLYGLSNWLVFGFPYYIFAILFAFYLAPRIRESRLLSIPDQLYRHYGTRNGIIGTIYTFFMTLPAPYVLMTGFLLKLVTGWPAAWCIIIGALFSMVYVISGGFNAVVRTDKLQFLLMFGGFALMFVELIINSGGFAFLKENLPPQHLSLQGGNSLQYLLVWFFIALWTLVDPGFHQRCYAAKTPRTARNGILFSVLFWMVFDFLTTACGLYARALMPDIEPVLSFPLLSHRILSPLLSGFFLTGLLATVMSTLDSNFLLSAITLGHDIFARFSPHSISTVRLTRLGLLISAVLSVLLALVFPSVIQLLYIIGTLFIPSMLVPVLGSYFTVIRLGKRTTAVQLLLPFFISLFFLMQSLFRSPDPVNLQFWLGIQPMYTGMAASGIILLAGIIQRERKK
ncbi:MAG: sodium:solute symporter family protein [Calditrichia bacterium]